MLRAACAERFFDGAAAAGAATGAGAATAPGAACGVSRRGVPAGADTATVQVRPLAVLAGGAGVAAGATTTGGGPVRRNADGRFDRLGRCDD